MPEEEKPKEEQKESVKVPFNGILEILAKKVSRKASIVAMAMILIYLLAATPAVTEILLFVGTIGGLAVFFTTLQFIVDTRDDKKDKKGRGIHKDPPGGKDSDT